VTWQPDWDVVPGPVVQRLSYPVSYLRESHTQCIRNSARLIKPVDIITSSANPESLARLLWSPVQILVKVMARYGVLAVFVAVLAGVYQLYVKPLLVTLGKGRIIESIGNEACIIVPELQACESGLTSLIPQSLTFTRPQRSFYINRLVSSTWHAQHLPVGYTGHLQSDGSTRLEHLGPISLPHMILKLHASLILKPPVFPLLVDCPCMGWTSYHHRPIHLSYSCTW